MALKMRTIFLLVENWRKKDKRMDINHENIVNRKVGIRTWRNIAGSRDELREIIRSSYKVAPDWLDETMQNNTILNIQYGGLYVRRRRAMKR